MQTGESFRIFGELDVYRAARSCRKGMCAVAGTLPEVENDGLAGQIRRAVVSLTDNVAEGHGRFHYLDQIKFIQQARGSFQELMDGLDVCQDEENLTVAETEQLKAEGSRVSQLIRGCIRYLGKCNTGQTLGLLEESAEYHAEEALPDLCWDSIPM